MRRNGRPSVEGRFWEKIAVPSPRTKCWLWTAALDISGYGVFRVAEKMVKAHRFSYTLARGPIPDGLQVDHLCRVRRCVNPDHMELVTNRENFLRGSALTARLHHLGICIRGHALAGENARRSGGRVRCRICTNEAARRYRQRRMVE